ncbi:DEAD/DEAH box helicase family protein [Saprospiraceae bacterium]|nr:DEAD/DEAH box helicase family protein [Saprospiraceae bacterium]
MSYLGYRGYTILKKNITASEQEKIRNELTIAPKNQMPGFAKLPAYPIYRESQEKMYLPKWFGFDKFGPYKKEKINNGEDINVSFNGSVREEQLPVVDAYMKSNYGGLLELPCGFGKTVIALNILSSIKKKTIIIVHKEFLVSQWIERIEQFLPDVTIGKIQGKTTNIDADIVICMLQSIAMKDYPIDMFSSFGLTIIDECHHMSAEVFSNALFKIVTKKMLGLSATMTRKDGLSCVFKMFIGPVLIKKKRKENKNVVVKVERFKTTGEEYNNVEVSYNGRVNYSKMISKLCNSEERTNFIIKKLQEIFSQDKQILILGQYKSLLVALYKQIEELNFATIGYYMGGMKQKDLKLSEEKQIIIATYAMAEEALDIKSLNTLIMVTPKSNIIQSVGRVMRNPNSKPLILDFVDSHECFLRQWKKREKYYKKQQYKILDGDKIVETQDDNKKILGVSGVCLI